MAAAAPAAASDLPEWVTPPAALAEADGGGAGAAAAGARKAYFEVLKPGDSNKVKKGWAGSIDRVHLKRCSRLRVPGVLPDI